MESLNYIFYGSIIALILLQGIRSDLTFNEYFSVTSRTISGRENQTASLGCPANETIRNINLSYGNTQFIQGRPTRYIPSRGINIEVINRTSCLNRNNCSFTVNNGLVGRDPVPNTPKYWKINYVCDSSYLDAIKRQNEANEAARRAREAAEAAAKAKAEAEAATRAKAEAEARARAEATSRARAEAEAKAKAEAEAKARAEALERERLAEIARAKAAAEAAAKAKAEAEAKARAEAEAKAKAEAEAKARAAVAARAKAEAESKMSQAKIVLDKDLAIQPLPSFMEYTRLSLPLNDTELQEYKLFHITIVSCVIKNTINTKQNYPNISFGQLYHENLVKMSIEPRIFERNLKGYINAIKKQINLTWKEVFESKLFLDAITDNIQYYLTNPSQSKLNDKQQPIGTMQNIRKPIINEVTFLSAYNICKLRINSLEVYNPISYSSQLYD